MILIHFRSWRALAFRGALGVAFGASALIWPAATVRTLVVLLAAYMLADGMAALAALGPRPADGAHRRGALVVEAALGITGGLVTFFWPSLPTYALLHIVAGCAVLSGLIEVAAGLWWRRLFGGIALTLAGVASIALGALIVARPGVALTVLTWCVGVYALGFGATMVAFALRLRPLDQSRRDGEPGAAAA